MKRILLVLGYFWALPATLAGFVVAALGKADFVDSDDEWCFHFVAREGGACWKFFEAYGMAAFTVGAVIVYKIDGYRRFPELVRHEREHFYQARRWGIFMMPAYYLHSLWLYFKGRDPYRENWFEVQAYEREKDI